MTRWTAYENSRLVDVSSLPVRYVHGFADLHVIGGDAHVAAYKFRRFLGAIVKVPVLEIIWPLDVDVPGQLRAMLQHQLAADIESRLHH